MKCSQSNEERFYKTLRAGGESIYATGFVWKLPHGKRPGIWMPPVKKLSMCENGYHLTTAEHLIDWLNEEIYEAEWRGEILRDGNKVVVSQARLIRKLETWNERTARLFACDCAERVLKYFEREHPKDKRPRKAILTARRYANEKASQEDLAAAWAAAWAAARAAAWDAARAAAWAAARAAAQDAARDAAQAAAWAAAWDAAWTAEKKWQIKRLWKYLNGELPK